MPTAAELRTQRASTIANARQLHDRAAAENRDLTADENTQFTNMMAEADRLGAQARTAEQREQLDAMEAELRANPGRRTVAGVPAAARQLDAHQAGELFRSWTLAGAPTGRPDADTLFRAAEHGVDLNAQVLVVPATRAMSAGTTTAGGYTVQQSFSSELEKALSYFFPVADAFEVFQTEDGTDYPWPTVDDTANSGEEVAEAGAISSNQDPTFGQVTFKGWEWFSPIVKVSHKLLRDSSRNIPALLAELFGERWGRKLDASCISANAGTATAEGIHNGVTVGVNLATGNPFTYAKLLALESSVPLAYRNLPGVGFIMHDGTFQKLRELVDSTGRPLIGSGDLANGTDRRLMGYPVRLSNNMTSINTPGDNQPLISFGAHKKYKVRKIGGATLTRLNELYAGNGQVGFVLHQAYDARWVTKAGVRTLNSFDS